VVCEQCEAFEVSVALIEDKAAGTQLIQELIYEVCTRSPATSRNRAKSCACTPRLR
jgi:hypothetical protein